MTTHDAMVTLPAADLSSLAPDADGSTLAKAEAMCDWPAHEILSMEFVHIWLCLSLALLWLYNSCMLSALCL